MAGSQYEYLTAAIVLDAAVNGPSKDRGWCRARVAKFVRIYIALPQSVLVKRLLLRILIAKRLIVELFFHIFIYSHAVTLQLPAIQCTPSVCQAIPLVESSEKHPFSPGIYLSEMEYGSFLRPFSPGIEEQRWKLSETQKATCSGHVQEELCSAASDDLRCRFVHRLIIRLFLTCPCIRLLFKQNSRRILCFFHHRGAFCGISCYRSHISSSRNFGDFVESSV